MVSSEGEGSASPVKDGSVSPDSDRKEPIDKEESNTAEDTVEMPSDREGSPVEDQQLSEKEPSPARKVQSPQKGKTEKGIIYDLCSRCRDSKKKQIVW